MDINKATKIDLETLPGIGPSRALSIIQKRQEFHGCLTPDAFMSILDIPAPVWTKLFDSNLIIFKEEKEEKITDEKVDQPPEGPGGHQAEEDKIDFAGAQHPVTPVVQTKEDAGDGLDGSKEYSPHTPASSRQSSLNTSLGDKSPEPSYSPTTTVIEVRTPPPDKIPEFMIALRHDLSHYSEMFRTTRTARDAAMRELLSVEWENHSMHRQLKIRQNAHDSVRQERDTLREQLEDIVEREKQSVVSWDEQWELLLLEQGNVRLEKDRLQGIQKKFTQGKLQFMQDIHQKSRQREEELEKRFQVREKELQEEVQKKGMMLQKSYQDEEARLKEGFQKKEQELAHNLMKCQEQEEKRQEEKRQEELQKKQTAEELEMEQRGIDYEIWLQARKKRKQQEALQQLQEQERDCIGLSSTPYQPNGEKHHYSVLRPVTSVHAGASASGPVSASAPGSDEIGKHHSYTELLNTLDTRAPSSCYVPHQQMVSRSAGLQEGPPSSEPWGEPPPVNRTTGPEAGVPRPPAEPSRHFARHEQRHQEEYQRRSYGHSYDRGIGSSYTDPTTNFYTDQQGTRESGGYERTGNDDYFSRQRPLQEANPHRSTCPRVEPRMEPAKDIIPSRPRYQRAEAEPDRIPARPRYEHREVEQGQTSRHQHREVEQDRTPSHSRDQHTERDRTPSRSQHGSDSEPERSRTSRRHHSKRYNRPRQDGSSKGRKNTSRFSASHHRHSESESEMDSDRSSKSRPRSRGDSKYNKRDSHRDPKVANYDGKTPWRAYEIQLNHIADKHRWTTGEMLDKLVQALRDKALSFYGNQPLHVRESYRKLAKKFNARFGPKEPPRTARKQLDMLLQTVDEKLEEFAERAQQVATDAWGDINEETADTAAVEAFLQGCKDKQAALYALEQDPDTMDEALELVKKAIHNHRILYGSRHSAPASKIRTVQFSESPASTTKSVPSEVEELKRQMGTLNTDVTNKMDRILGMLQSRGSASPKKDIKCFRCNKLGHYANECRLPRSPPVTNRGASPIRGTPPSPSSSSKEGGERSVSVSPTNKSGGLKD